MKNEEGKKGLFGRIIGSNKSKKDPCCCNFELEEIPQENDEQSGEQAKKDEGNSCCK
ncbi:hypothetical protein [Dehalobacter restrictus]|jgi:hypothetical protein|uniref:hypothetical protein n=1 Tax=Dehalobacter restrictus TaxID=55583 RepID=UPI0033901F56